MAVETPEKEYIKAISEPRENKAKNRMRKDVSQVCKVLEKVHEKCKNRESGSLPDDLKNSLREHFRDIFFSLKHHLEFHGLPEDELRKTFGGLELVSLSDDEMEKDPDLKNVIDPGGSILEILSDITHKEDAPKGSPKHAEEVRTQVKSFARSLPRVFRPKALAKVSHNGKSFVGASIAVSPILRPIYLHNRIANFKKPRLREAVIFHQPLQTGDTQNWRSKATDTKDNPKPACTNCRNTFENLQGFILETDEADGENRTFLGACAEFCPVDKLLQEETNGCNSEDVEHLLRLNLKRCLTLYEKFDSIRKQCQEAVNTEDIQKIREVYNQIRPIVHIFGRIPNCNDSFGSNTIN